MTQDETPDDDLEWVSQASLKHLEALARADAAEARARARRDLARWRLERERLRGRPKRGEHDV